MAVTTTTRAVVVSPAMVRQKAARLLTSDARVLVLRARPDWPHGDVQVGDRTVRVVEGISQLAILDAYDRLGENEKIVVLTDRPREDLGESVLVRAVGQDIDLPDEWGAVPGLFPGANEVSGELRRRDWAATALLDHEPPGGWPRSPEPAVTAEHALGALLARLLTLNPQDNLDAVLLLTALGRRNVRSAWTAVDPALRKHLIAWARDDLGVTASFALQVAQRQEHVTPLAVALALDVLWPDDGEPVEEQVAARVRVEQYVDRRTLAVQDAKAVARLARTAVLRMGLDGEDSQELTVALRQAEALLDDLGWAQGAQRSVVLVAGLRARLADLAAALDARDGLEDALSRVREHRDGKDLETPAMAVRLARWLALPEQDTRGIAEDLQQHMDDGAWVDAALGAVWNGSDDPVVGAAYRRLIDAVRERRRVRDEVAAGRLDDIMPADMAHSGTVGELAFGVEAVLRGVVSPWREAGPSGKGGRGVLLVVLDGLSAAIATQLAGEVARAGMAEWVPSGRGRRLAVAAALPTLTEVSRASLFRGAVEGGDAAAEKKALAAAYPGSQVFHKDDLRAAGGHAVAEPVAKALADPRTPVVGVVINAIDDAVHKNDTTAAPWDLSRLAPLRALLDAAWQAKRTVVLTSDHGHVVERQTEKLDATDAEARWRRPSTGPVGDGEVHVSGTRVVGPEDGLVLLWRDDARYGRRQAGYHGGASLAELTVPVLVFQDATVDSGADGWQQAPPQAPAWWNDPVAEDKPAVDAPAPQAKKATKKPAAPRGQDALFDVTWSSPESAPAAPTSLVDAVLESATYAEQKRMAGRRAPGDATVAAVLDALVSREGRAHQETVAAAAGIPAAQIGPMLAMVRRILNVDGYPVIETDSDGSTLLLDTATLRTQFGIGG